MCSSTFFDDDGKPSFNTLQNYGSAKVPVFYFVFDVMVYRGRDVTHEPLTVRQKLLERKVLPTLSEPVRYAAPLDATLPVLLQSVRAQGLEGLVAKRVDSRYEPGLRSGAWMKMRVNRGQEFVIGGVHDRVQHIRRADLRLLRARSPAARRTDAHWFHASNSFDAVPEVPGAGDRHLSVREPAGSEKRPVGTGLTKAKMAQCRWLRPELVGQFEFVEWTSDNHLRHSKFVALREDKPPGSVTREQPPGESGDA